MMMNQPEADAGFAGRLRMMRIIWVMYLITVGVFVLVSYFARPSADLLTLEYRKDTPALLYGLAAVGFSMVIISFVVKGIYYRKAAETRQPAQAQTGFILALALCESAVIFGLVGLFVTWNSNAYLLFVLGALSMILHFPRREQLHAAHRKTTG
jgi:F0F1-type ATP synthase membrane subunit c/vacuolar-type H+-ATPase subunit K